MPRMPLSDNQSLTLLELLPKILHNSLQLYTEESCYQSKLVISGLHEAHLCTDRRARLFHPVTLGGHDSRRRAARRLSL